MTMELIKPVLTAEEADLKNLSISRLINVLRHYFGLSQDEMADEMGTTRVTVNTIENAPDTAISLDMLHRINFMARGVVLYKQDKFAVAISTELERRSAFIIRERMLNMKQERLNKKAESRKKR